MSHPVVNPISNKEKKAQAIAELWKRGELSFKLDKNQKELRKLYRDGAQKTNVWLLSRRSGKSYALCVFALEECLKGPNRIVKFLSPTKLQLTNNIRPIMRKILDDCPEEFKPEFKQKDQIYYFKNGSELQLAGTDGGHAEKLRGGDSHAWFIDEAGSCNDLENIVNSVLIPTTFITKGKGILASTPPSEPDHEFLKFIETAEHKGSLVKKTIYDNPRLTPKDIEEIIDELGGAQTDAFKREALCEIIKSASRAVLPEVTPELLKEIVKEWPTPPHRDCYVAMDVGGNDMTAVLFAYYDFRADKIVIEDEIEMNLATNMTMKGLAEAIDDKECKLWLNVYTNEVKRPYARISDTNPIVINEIRHHSNGTLNFVPTKKDDKDAALNNLRMLLSNKKIIIHPRCERLIKHLLNVKWKSDINHKEFARSPDDGHYDFVDAAVYLTRNITYTKNPYPSTYGLNMQDLHIQNPTGFAQKHQSSENVYKTIFGRTSTNKFKRN
jgi:hypothetical protein